MYYYRITKYNPKFRDSLGRYLKDEWTDFSDVGAEFDGHLFTLKEYEVMEAKYMKAIQLFLDSMLFCELQCNQVEKHLNTKEIPERYREIYSQVCDGYLVTKETLPELLKMIMRNYIWCTVFSRKIYIEFGYDFYLYIRISQACENAVKGIESLGLFVEDFKNPWIDY